MANEYRNKLHFPYVSFVFLIFGVISFIEPVFADKKRLFVQTSTRAIEVSVDVAQTEEERNRGLMFVQEMSDDDGMLFVFHQSRPVSMWMKNTFLPLDMLFADRRGKIIYIHRNAQPHDLTVITPPMPVFAVLEVVSGFADKHGVQIGDRLVYSLFKRNL
ncbi:DUF192 domain-containing protein [Sneathiella aquimaris]|uniref:DUF192 domain-containing protein n=1 Tax=Sneathiella aquimaris TaxID=2599305 RepID=UPI00146A16C8|nr:DUF192 domain-containing protein [Sneathiella aquimaris]